MKINVNYIPDGKKSFPADGEQDCPELTDLGFYVSTEKEKDELRDKHLPTTYVGQITGVLILGDAITIGVRKRA